MFIFSRMRLLFILSVLWGAAIFWISPHPPMIDLAQHAGQIALLHDLALKQSNWSDFVRVNVFTPYLLGYGVAFPLTFLFSVTTSLKIVLSTAFICYVAASIALRKKYNSDERLDWLFLLGFFGFSYSWGLYTFLVSAPIALLVILRSSIFAENPTRRNGLIVSCLGFILLASHGLAFAFACTVGGIIYLLNAKSIRAFLSNGWPFIFLALACSTYFIASQRTEAELSVPYGSRVSWTLGTHRVHELVLHSLGTTPSALFIFVAAVLLLMPWLLGLRLQWRDNTKSTMLIVVVLISCFVPNFALKTALLYQRFAIFFFPAYAFAFSTKNTYGVTSAKTPAMEKARRFILMPAVILACWAVLGFYTLEARRFAAESKEIDTLIGKMQPGARALALIFSPESNTIKNKNIYSNYASWYQAEYKGFVDFNFAWFPPQIVRFKPMHAALVDTSFTPTDFEWKKFEADQYKYFIVRRSAGENVDIFKGALCKPKLVESANKWEIYEKAECAN